MTKKLNFCTVLAYALIRLSSRQKDGCVERTTGRREFLSRLTSASGVEDLRLLKASRPAMGTRFEVVLPRRSRSHLKAVHLSLDEVRRLEGLMTVYDPASRTSQVNREASAHPVGVEEELAEVIELSLEVWKGTGGAFDITADSLWKMWGFFEQKGRVPDAGEIEATLQHVGSQYLKIDPEARTVSFLRDSMSLNFGGIGKGFALDKATHILQNAGLAEALLHGGHSSLYAFGDPAGSGRGWKVTLRNPAQPDIDIAAVWMDSMGMATSGAGERHFLSAGRQFGHVIDPRSGRPAEHHLSATALSPSAALADALSTAFFIMPLDEVEAYCSRNPRVGAVIVPGEEAGGRFVHRFGIASSCVEPFF